MKRPLDLLWPSRLFVRALALLLVILPAALTALSLGLEALGAVPPTLLGALTLSSLVLGAAVAGVFALLIVVEWAQDRAFDAWYRRQRGRPLPLGDGRFECQFCGSRAVRPGDSPCAVCGRKLE